MKSANTNLRLFILAAQKSQFARGDGVIRLAAATGSRDDGDSWRYSCRLAHFVFKDLGNAQHWRQMAVYDTEAGDATADGLTDPASEKIRTTGMWFARETAIVQDLPQDSLVVDVGARLAFCNTAMLCMRLDAGTQGSGAEVASARRMGGSEGTGSSVAPDGDAAS